MPPSRILLVRHGRSAHPNTGWVDHVRVAHWLTEYDRVGLIADDAPPESLRELARTAHVVSSPILRAQESAARLTSQFDTEPLLREAALVIPRCYGLRMPFALWGVAIGLRYAWGMKRSDPKMAAEIARAGEAAMRLASMEQETVLAVTHGAIRRFIADRLTARGWIATLPKKKWAHWSAWELRPPLT